MHTRPCRSQTAISILAFLLFFSLFATSFAQGTAPTATTQGANVISANSVTLNASVNPGSNVTTVWFEYGFDTNFSTAVSAGIPNPSFETNAYSTYPGYAYLNGNAIGGWVLTDGSRIGLNPAGGTLPFADNGAIPNGANVAFIQSDNTTNTLSTQITNLVTGTAYTVSFRANSRAQSYASLSATWLLNGGSFVPFTAAPPVGSSNPYYTNSGSFVATGSTANLVLRNISPTDTTVLVDAFTIQASGPNSATNTLPATNTALAVATTLTGLQPNTLYYFRVRAQNNLGSVTGAVLTVTTPRLPTTLVVTSGANSGAGTLRDTLANTVIGDTVTFDSSLSGATIMLSSQLSVANQITIDASALVPGLRLNGNATTRILQVQSNATLVVNGLTFTNGGGVSGGGAIHNSGTLILNRCTLAGNSVIGDAGGAGGYPGGGGGPGGNGFGGAIYNQGGLTLNQCTLANNSAMGGSGGTGGLGADNWPYQGGRGGTGGTGGTGGGAAVYNSGTLTINHCTLASNSTAAGSGGAGGASGYGSPGGGVGFVGANGTAAAAGLYQSGTATLFNSIIANNTPSDTFGSFTQTGPNVMNTPAQLGSLADNGGSTYTMILLAGSPAYEAGAPNALFTTDQRGQPRTQGVAPDIGAVELPAPNVATLSATSIGISNATLNASVNPNNFAGSAYLEYGIGTNYGSVTATNTLPATNFSFSISFPVSGLSSGTLYNFRVVYITAFGTSRGSNVTFTTLVGPPMASTAPATSIAVSNATLNGFVYPGGLPTQVYFQYGTTLSYGNVSSTNTLPATNATLAASNAITGLVPGTLYHFRTVVVNSAGATNGADQTFTTLPLAPVVTTLTATSITSSNALLNGLVNPGNDATTVYFDYSSQSNYDAVGVIPNPSFEANSFGTFPGYVKDNNQVITGWTYSDGARIGLNPAGGSPFADNGAIPNGANVAFIQSNGQTNTLSTTITGLVPGFTYQVNFRANCRAGYGPLISTWSLNGGPLIAFTASPAVGGSNPYYTNSGTFIATNTTAALVLCNFSTNDTTLLLDAFTMTTNATSGSITGIVVNPGFTPIAVSNLLSGLKPVTTYHFRARAANSGGYGVGADVTFTTPAGPPTVTTLLASNINASRATLNASINPNGSATKVYFRYGLTTSYGSVTSTNTVAAATNLFTTVTNLITGLTSATLYHFQAVATNDAGITFGADQTFVTSNAPPDLLNFASAVIGTNVVNGVRTMQLGFALRPNGIPSDARVEYGLSLLYGGTNYLPTVPGTTIQTNLSTTPAVSAGFTYHWRVVATNGGGITVSPDQTISLGTLDPGGPAGDLNHDGVVSRAELNAVYNNYATNSPWLLITNVVGLGTTNVSFGLSNSVEGAYTILYSSNLVNWLPLGPATPRYNFTDTNAPAASNRYYRLSYP